MKKIFEVLMWQGSRMTVQEFVDLLQKAIESNSDNANKPTDTIYIQNEWLTPPPPEFQPNTEEVISPLITIVWSKNEKP